MGFVKRLMWFFGRCYLLDLGFNNEIYKELFFFMRCIEEDLVLIIIDLFNENNVLWKNSINVISRGWTFNCSI